MARSNFDIRQRPPYQSGPETKEGPGRNTGINKPFHEDPGAGPIYPNAPRDLPDQRDY